MRGFDIRHYGAGRRLSVQHHVDAFLNLVLALNVLGFVALAAFGLAAWRLRAQWSWPLVAAGALGIVVQLVDLTRFLSQWWFYLLTYVAWLALILIAGILMYRDAHSSR
jgi:hypothetical protein